MSKSTHSARRLILSNSPKGGNKKLEASLNNFMHKGTYVLCKLFEKMANYISSK